MCDYRHRPRSVSETAWVFPKQAQEIFTSVAEYQQLVDTRWYKQDIHLSDFTNPHVNGVRSNDRLTASSKRQRSYDSDTDESSVTSDEDMHQSLINNNYKIPDHKTPYSVNSVDFTIEQDNYNCY